MQIIFFAKNRDPFDSLSLLPEEKMIFLWHGQELPPPPASEGIVFFDYDDQDFDLLSFFDQMREQFPEEKRFLKVLISGNLSVKEFKKLQNGNKFIDGLIRAPIKLKDIETFVEDYKLVQNEMRESMEGAKKSFKDPVNAEIQRKFDLVFSELSAGKNAPQSTVFNHGENATDGELNLEGESSMSESVKKMPSEQSSPTLDINLDLGSEEIEFDTASAEEAPPATPLKTESTAKLAVVPDDDGLEFNLDFGDDSAENSAPPAAPVVDNKLNSNKSGNDSHFELDALFDAELESANEGAAASLLDGTQKTIIYNKSQLTDIGLDSFSNDDEATEIANSSADLMTTEEAKANIESTIKDILKPKNLDSTQEMIISAMTEAEVEAEEKSLNTPSIGFNFKGMSQDSATSEFDLSSVELADKEDIPEPSAHKSAPVSTHRSSKNEEMIPPPPIERAHTSFVSDEESTRFQATIRQLREEREDLIAQIKTLKVETRELEQDNLTLKAALDESKIEVSILRKRHMVEMEDIKYRLSINEEKKALAEERARIAEGKREKLEQRVRIDFNQVKQREKELETKLEILSIDVDSQVQSRDQKILELRRKIDALEFNMENVTIKEQKSHDDKRKLEDKLNKIMKTLRHSIKNLEDDIDQATDDGQDENESDGHRSKA